MRSHHRHPGLKRVPALLVAVALCSTSCGPAWIRQTGRPMDRLAEKLEEFGSISMSAPLLAPPGDSFAFDLDRDVGTYFTEAKTEIEGGAATLDQTLQSFSMALSAEYDPTQVGAFAEKLRLYHSQVSRLEGMQKRLDADALSQYRAQLKAADAETDPATKQQMRDDARTKLAAAMQPAATPPAFPAAEALPTKPEAQPTPSSPFLDAGKFAAAGALLGDKVAPVLSNRAALVTAAGDKAVEAVFNLLGNPAGAQQFKGRRVVFGAAVVSVEPGWRTRKDFAADLSVRLGYSYDEARRDVVEALVLDPKLDEKIRGRLAIDYAIRPAGDVYAVAAPGSPIPFGWECPLLKGGACRDTERRNPVTTAVSPLTDVQSLDLASASRQMDQFALALAFAMQSAGVGGDVSALESSMHSRQKDVHTRTAAVAANSYSAGGGVFGYQIGPKLRAIDDPATDMGPANVLDRQSFPVLVVLGMDDADARPLLRWEDDGRLHVYEPVVTFMQTARWIPLKEPWYSFLGFGPPRWSDEDRLELSYQLNRAALMRNAWADWERCDLTPWGCPPPGEVEASKGALRLADERVTILKYLGFGSGLSLTLPVNVLVPDQLLATTAASTAARSWGSRAGRVH